MVTRRKGLDRKDTIQLFCRQHLSREDMIQLLTRLMAGHGPRQCGRDWDVDFREISKVLKGQMYPGERLMQQMGIEPAGQMWKWRQQ